MNVSVTVKHTFIHCAFDEDTDSTEVSSRGCRSKSMERMTNPDDKAAVQMSKLGKILQDDKEAVRSARAPISIFALPKKAHGEPIKDAPPPKADGDASPKRPPSPEQLMQLRDKLDDKLDPTRKWTGSAAVPEEDTEIRPSLSNSSVSTMTSFEANRSRASSNDTSNGSISSQMDEIKQETVQMIMHIEEEPHRPNPWHSTWHGHYHETTKWKPKHNHDYASKPNYGYNKSQRWDSWGQDSSSGESMMGSTFTTPTPSPKFTKDMMHGQWGMNKDKRNLPRDSRHNRVPRNVNLQEEYQSKVKEVTTLMIRNIPNRYTQRELISELEDLGFAGTFDFLYSPLDKGTMSNVGYAFVNFKSHEYASKCIEAFHNYRFKRHRKTSGKVAAVSAAHLQGLEANLTHYEKTAVNTAKMKQRRPVVLANISSLTA